MLFSRKQAHTDDDTLPGAIRVHTMQDDLSPSPEASIKTTSPAPPMPNEASINPFGTPAPEPQQLSAQKATSPAPAANMPSFAPLLGEIGPGKSPQDNLISFTPTITTSPEPETSSKSPALVIVLSLLIVALFAGGGYYFWTTRMQNVSETTQPLPTNTPTPAAPALFSLTSPNTLPILAENRSPQGIARNLKQIADQVKNTNIDKPVEFLLTDQDNNPITLGDFLTMSGIVLPQEVLAGSSGSFSLFFYNDAERVRSALVIGLADTSVAKSALQKSEVSLTKNLQPLFLDPTTPQESSVFQESSYKNTSIRYFNIDTANALSIDYAFLADRLVIATSKNTGRILLDQLTQ